MPESVAESLGCIQHCLSTSTRAIALADRLSFDAAQQSNPIQQIHQWNLDTQQTAHSIVRQSYQQPAYAFVWAATLCWYKASHHRDKYSAKSLSHWIQPHSFIDSLQDPLILGYLVYSLLAARNPELMPVHLLVAGSLLPHPRSDCSCQPDISSTIIYPPVT